MPQQATMRRQFFELLAYPRQLAMANVNLSSCPHSGFFKVLDAKCSECSKNYECDWLNSTDDFNDLAEKPMEFLYRALTFGIDYVDASKAMENHGGADCECDSCEWLRNAEQLVQEYAHGR